jgi:hypothetical protein
MDDVELRRGSESSLDANASTGHIFQEMAGTRHPEAGAAEGARGPRGEQAGYIDRLQGTVRTGGGSAVCDDRCIKTAVYTVWKMGIGVSGVVGNTIPAFFNLAHTRFRGANNWITDYVLSRLHCARVGR